TLWIAGPSMVGDFHPLISTGLPAHTVFIYSSFNVSADQCGGAYQFLQLEILDVILQNRQLMLYPVGLVCQNSRLKI
ncbi:hypothetical protein, partial [Enterobacter sp.]|uniref:hypothetical protein n=1 Tax=Enterobacter sp. TaxID=42895 RepID=UPI00290364A0